MTVLHLRMILTVKQYELLQQFIIILCHITKASELGVYSMLYISSTWETTEACLERAKGTVLVASSS